MATTLTHQTITGILKTAGIKDAVKGMTSLGGGEMNNTYRIETSDQLLILRVAKDKGQQTLLAEARALQLLDSPHIPKLVYFDPTDLLDGCVWILQSYIPGTSAKRLTPAQFGNLGKLLAQTHKIQGDENKVDVREQFLDVCEAFGDEQYLLQHPDTLLRDLIQKLFKEFTMQQPLFNVVKPVLIHSDATPSNILVHGDSVGLIDWEFSKFNDPMADFSTIYYEDMEFNKGKWRIQITPAEKKALFDAYTAAGGNIDQKRINFWMRFDKLGAAVFLYWRLHNSKRATSNEENLQFELDYNNLLHSLISVPK